MQRITITIDDDLLEALDGMCQQRGYQSRSEAIRDLVRPLQTQQAAQGTHGPCVAALTYVFEHATRNLPARLIGDQHDHEDITVATLHVHLNHDDCMEVAVLRGDVGKVQALADSVTTQRGVRHSNLHIVPVAPHHGPHGARKKSKGSKSA